jgi:uncharacterized membrane protein YhaH (DUF805 family)
MNFLFGFRGRIRRTGFVLFVVATLALTVVVGLPGLALWQLAHTAVRAGGELGATRPEPAGEAVGLLVEGVATPWVLAGLTLTVVIAAWIELAVATKRLHDAGGSAWWLLTSLVPGLNLLLFLALCLWPGTAGVNRYGGDPRALQMRA